eukprot:6214110-Pleurochrysis_carterae.AAC.11
MRGNKSPELERCIVFAFRIGVTLGAIATTTVILGITAVVPAAACVRVVACLQQLRSGPCDVGKLLRAERMHLPAYRGRCLATQAGRVRQVELHLGEPMHHVGKLLCTQLAQPASQTSQQRERVLVGRPKRVRRTQPDDKVREALCVKVGGLGHGSGEEEGDERGRHGLRALWQAAL